MYRTNLSDFAVAGETAAKLISLYSGLEKYLIKNLIVPSSPLDSLLEDQSQCVMKGIKCCTCTLAPIFRVAASVQSSLTFCFTFSLPVLCHPPDLQRPA